MKKSLFLLSILFVIILITGCGGGGSDSTSLPQSQNQDVEIISNFYLYPPNYFSEGHKESYQLSGTDLNNLHYNCVYTVDTEEKQTLDGKTVTPIKTLLKLTNIETNATLTNLRIIYYDENFKPVKRVVDSDTIWLPVEINILPNEAKIGDIGALTEFESNNGAIATGLWSLDRHDNIHARLSSMYTIFDENDEKIMYQEETFVIDENGEPKKLLFKKVNYEADNTLTMSGSRTL